MTNDTEYGPEIVVDGVRPEWLRDDDLIYSEFWPDPALARDCVWWTWREIRLPASHPYYTVHAHNAKHGTQLKYWPGGDEAPGDWDGDEYGVLYRDGMKGGRRAQCWRNYGGDANIIGYTPKPCAAVCESCDGTGVDLYDGTANDCQTCHGRGSTSAENAQVADFVPCERTVRMALDRLPRKVEGFDNPAAASAFDECRTALEALLPKRDRAEELVKAVMGGHCPWSRNAVRYTIERLIAQGEIRG